MSTATTHIKTDKQLVPALRFDEFEGDWEKKNLGEVSNFLDGRRKPIKSGDRAKYARRVSLLWCFRYN